jgi:hypothetical protein
MRSILMLGSSRARPTERLPILHEWINVMILTETEETGFPAAVSFQNFIKK